MEAELVIKRQRAAPYLGVNNHRQEDLAPPHRPAHQEFARVTGGRGWGEGAQAAASCHWTFRKALASSGPAPADQSSSHWRARVNVGHTGAAASALTASVPAISYHLLFLLPWDPLVSCPLTAPESTTFLISANEKAAAPRTHFCAVVPTDLALREESPGSSLDGPDQP